MPSCTSQLELSCQDWKVLQMSFNFKDSHPGRTVQFKFYQIQEHDSSNEGFLPRVHLPLMLILALLPLSPALADIFTSSFFVVLFLA